MLSQKKCLITQRCLTLRYLMSWGLYKPLRTLIMELLSEWGIFGGEVEEKIMPPLMISVLMYCDWKDLLKIKILKGISKYLSFSSCSEKLLKICTLIISIPNFLCISVIVNIVIIVMMGIEHTLLSIIKLIMAFFE